LLLPRSGAAFNAATNAITLQWASVADLRNNELYRITVEDLTSGNGVVLVEYVQDTKYIIPTSYRPLDASPHIFQWSVTVARQINSEDNNPIYEIAGYESENASSVGWALVSLPHQPHKLRFFYCLISSK